jgi:hypothetical protein
MIPDKNIINYTFVDHTEIYNLGVDFVNIRGRLKKMNFKIRGLKMNNSGL